MMNKVFVNCAYINIKTGNIYIVEGFAKHSETLEELVLYRREDGEELWVRPVELFKQKFRNGALADSLEEVDPLLCSCGGFRYKCFLYGCIK